MGLGLASTGKQVVSKIQVAKRYGNLGIVGGIIVHEI
jgi:hypothetical protein